MNNHEIINLVEEIVQPHFKFEMDDFYGDRGGAPYPKIENLKILYFKKNDKKLVMTKTEEHSFLDKIKALNVLNIDSVEIIKFPYIGHFICIHIK